MNTLNARLSDPQIGVPQRVARQQLRLLLTAALSLLLLCQPASADRSICSDAGVPCALSYDGMDFGPFAPAVVCWQHPAWATMPEAKWISTSYYTESPGEDTWRLFSHDFEKSADEGYCCALIHILSDNGYRITLNGTPVGERGTVYGVCGYDSPPTYSSVDTYSISHAIHSGTNKLEVLVRNCAIPGAASTANPSAVCYRVDLGTELNVWDVQAHQRRNGSYVVDVFYSFCTSDGTPHSVSMAVSDNNGESYEIEPISVTGDIGPAVYPGPRRHIAWDAGTDMPEAVGSDYKVRITVTKSENTSAEVAEGGAK